MKEHEKRRWGFFYPIIFDVTSIYSKAIERISETWILICLPSIRCELPFRGYGLETLHKISLSKLKCWGGGIQINTRPNVPSSFR